MTWRVVYAGRNGKIWHNPTPDPGEDSYRVTDGEALGYVATGRTLADAAREAGVPIHADVEEALARAEEAARRAVERKDTKETRLVLEEVLHVARHVVSLFDIDMLTLSVRHVDAERGIMVLLTTEPYRYADVRQFEPGMTVDVHKR